MIRINLIDGVLKQMPPATAEDIFYVCFVAFLFNLIMIAIIGSITYMINSFINL